MSETVNTRRYRSTLRAERATQTRRSILASSRHLFMTRGYTATTIQEIADSAAVNADTVYRSVGRKPELLRALVESAITGAPGDLTGNDSDVARIASAPTAGEKLDLYAQTLVAVQQRLAPIVVALRAASFTDESCQALRADLNDRWSSTMRNLAANLRSTGELRADLDDAMVTDVLWSMSAAEYWVLLVDERGWSPERVEAWLADAWRRMLLASPQPAARASRAGQAGPP